MAVVGANAALAGVARWGAGIRPLTACGNPDAAAYPSNATIIAYERRCRSARPRRSSGPTDRSRLPNRLNSAAIHLLRRILRRRRRWRHLSSVVALSVLVYGGPRTVSVLARREGVATPT